jgi:hypothetical protein
MKTHDNRTGSNKGLFATIDHTKVDPSSASEMNLSITFPPLHIIAFCRSAYSLLV